MKIGVRTHILALAVAVSMLTGCSMANTMNYSYPNAESYEAGDREVTEAITDIDIDYATGRIELTSAPSNTLTIEETANSDLSDEQRVHTWVEGTTLHVRYCAANQRLDFTNVNKHLTLAIPEDSSLATLAIEASSADLESSGVAAKEIDVETSSGDVRLSSKGACDKLAIGTSSGKIQAEVETCKSATFDTSSGDVSLEAGKVDSLVADTSSGTCSLSFAKEAKSSHIDTSSGDVTVRLPDPCDLKLTVETSSGDFISDLPFKKSGDAYICGSGANEMDISTSSGDVTVSRR